MTTTAPTAAAAVSPRRRESRRGCLPWSALRQRRDSGLQQRSRRRTTGFRQRLSRVPRREGAVMHTSTYDRSYPSPTPARPGGHAAVADLGTLGWVDRTGGQLSGAERRSLLGSVARTHAVNAAGRLLMLARLNSGRRARVAPSLLVPPTSALTRAAVEQAQRRLAAVFGLVDGCGVAGVGEPAGRRG